MVGMSVLSGFPPILEYKKDRSGFALCPWWQKGEGGRVWAEGRMVVGSCSSTVHSLFGVLTPPLDMEIKLDQLASLLIHRVCIVK